MYLLDTNVISEIRKGELRRGMELIRHRGDHTQTSLLEEWLNSVLVDYAEYILDLDADIAQIWGRLRVPRHENAIDKQIAATALIHDLTLVTRNVQDFCACGVHILNPFTESDS